MTSHLPSGTVSGVVLLGHGSREPGTATEIKALGEQLAAGNPEWRIEHAFLNQEPHIEHAVKTLVEAGCQHIVVLPLLVFVGKHILEDVPGEIERLQALYPTVRIVREPHLFRLPGFSDLLSNTLKTSESNSVTSSASLGN